MQDPLRIEQSLKNRVFDAVPDVKELYHGSPSIIEGEFLSKEIETYLSDPVLFAREEWDWNASPDEAVLMKQWSDLEILDFQLMAARGTGKSTTVAILTVWGMVFLPTIYGGYMTRILAGSGDQAKRTYNYVRDFLTTGPRVSKLLSFQPQKIYAQLKNGATCQVYKLSRQQVHGEHPDLIVVDEACDAEREEGGEIVSSALQAISSSRHGRRILDSTPYFAFGLFAQRWNNAKELGISTHHWTAEVGKRTWITLEKQTKEWERAESDPTVNIRVEWYGSFGESVGQVHRPEDVDRATVEYDRTRTKGAPGWLSIDWGFVHPTVLGVWELRRGKMFLLKIEAFTKASIEDLCQRATELNDRYELSWMFTDSSGVFQNQRLGELGNSVVPVTFSTEKEKLIGIVNKLLATRKIAIHPEFKTLLQQMKAYTRDPKTGKPVKANDDWEDCLLCAAKATSLGIDSSRGVQVGFGPKRP